MYIKACMVYTTYLPGMSQSLIRFTMQIRKALFPPAECLSLFWALRKECLFTYMPYAVLFQK